MILFLYRPGKERFRLKMDRLFRLNVLSSFGLVSSLSRLPRTPPTWRLRSVRCRPDDETHSYIIIIALVKIFYRTFHMYFHVSQCTYMYVYVHACCARIKCKPYGYRVAALQTVEDV